MDITDVLSGRAGLAGLHEVLFGSTSRRWVREELQALLEDGATHRRSPPRRVKFKPGRKLTAHFDVWIRTGRSMDTRPIVVRWQRTENDLPTFTEVEPLEAEAADRGLLSPFLGLASRELDRGSSILVWPLDTRLPQIVRLSHPPHVRELLATAGADARKGPTSISPIRYRPGERHVLRYGLQSGGAVFAKISRDGDVMREFRIARHVGAWLHEENIGAAPPLAAIVEDETILFTGIRGRPLSQLLGGPEGHMGAPLRLAGSLLRRLHSAPSSLVQDLPGRGLRSEVKAVTRGSEHIATLLPGAKEIIGEILDLARAEYDILPKEPASLIHGDFKADHLIVSRPGLTLTLIDFGSCGLGDPALDVGKFLADLSWWRLDGGRGTGDEEPRFLEGYGWEAHQARLSRSRIFQALFLVKLAAHRVPLFAEGWASRVSLLLRRARTLLQPPRPGARRTTEGRASAKAEGSNPYSL